jgi:predicted transcriptional regulator
MTVRKGRAMVTIEVSDTIKSRLDAIVADAVAREHRDGEANGMTDYTGALEWALDMAVEAAPEMAAVLV